MKTVPLVGIEPTWTATVSTPYKSEPIQGRALFCQPLYSTR